MKLEQAARQALEALEEIAATRYPSNWCEALHDEITALREALALYDSEAGIEQAELMEENISHHKSEQEPVAWIDNETWCFTYSQYEYEDLDDDMKDDLVPLYTAPVRTRDLTDIEDLQDAVTKSLKKAFHLGQTYWQQADSESYAANKRAADSLDLYRKLEDDTRAVIAADREKNRG